MPTSPMIRRYLAALRALLLLTVVTGLAYPLAVWAVASAPHLHDKAEGSLLDVNGRTVGSAAIGQSFTDTDGAPLVQYFQPRPSVAGDGYDPTATSASNLGPESIRDTPADPAKLAQGATPAEAGFKAGLLTTVCSRSRDVGQLEQVDGSRPFCTPGGVGAVLSVIGPRDPSGNVENPSEVVSVNEPCAADPAVPVVPFLGYYEGVPVHCATYGEDYAIGQLVPIRGDAPSEPRVPSDAVTASGSGLDPHISPAYADLQAPRVAAARGITLDQVRALIADNQDGRTLGFLGQPRVNVLELNAALDVTYPAKG